MKNGNPPPRGFRHATGHAIARIAERHKIVPTEQDWTQAVLDIIDAVAGVRRHATMLQRSFAGDARPSERWLVRVCGVPVAVAYSPVEAVIVTVLEDPGPRQRSRLPSHYRQNERGRGRRERPVTEQWGDEP